MKSLRISSLLLVFVILISSVILPSCSGNGTTTTPEDPKFQFSTECDYLIVTGKDYMFSTHVENAAIYMQSVLKSAYGIDAMRNSAANGARSEEKPLCEILIGDTGRPESDEAMADLRANDYVCRVINENLIVICGGSPSATFVGVREFCNAVAYGESGLLTKLEIGYSLTENKRYKIDEQTLNDVSISDYTIAVHSLESVDLAWRLAYAMGEQSGLVPSVALYSELTGDEKAVICLGATDRSGTTTAKENIDGYFISATDDEDGVTIAVSCADDALFDAAFDELLSQIKTVSEGKSRVYTSMMLNALAYLEKWELEARRETVITEGLIYTYYYYVNSEERPYRVYVLEADPDYIGLHMGSANDGYEYAPKVRQTTLGHMESAEKSGLNVFAGVNGDFFAINGDYHPTGTTIKNGQLISEGNRVWPFVAFTKDGEMRCYTSIAAADVSELTMAVGGKNMLLDDHVLGDLEMDTAFSYTPHPRTLAGVREDGTMVFVVVDGRQADYSNGAPLDRCAYIMASLGCMDAINLDGGGSSTMIIEKNGEFKTMNSPSDGNLRRIYNSVLLVEKQDK